MDQKLRDLSAVVTGGASGIGAAIAAKLQSMGAQVAVLDLNPADLPEGQIGFACDVSTTPRSQRPLRESLQRLAASTL